jgi:hypothetical protein
MSNLYDELVGMEWLILLRIDSIFSYCPKIWNIYQTDFVILIEHSIAKPYYLVP